MIRVIKKLTLLFAGIVLLRIAALWITESSNHLSQVVEKDFDPSMMFYTESADVLKAEKSIGNKTKQLR